jgi:multiple sugar transport system substrate-binding protein
LRSTSTLKLALMIALAAVLTVGCGTGEAESPESPGDWSEVDPTGQTVTFWHQHSQEREEELERIVQEFNETNEWDITVEALYQGSYQDIFQQMLPLLNTDDAPSLVVAYQNQAATYQQADALVDINPLLESEEWGLPEEDREDFFDSFYEQDVFPTFDNARLGFPPNRSLEALYYNRDWLEELGYDGPPETPEEFEEMACAAAEEPFSGARGEGSVGFPLSISASTFASLVFARGGDIYDEGAGEYTYDTAEAVDAMEMLQRLFDRGCASLVTEDFGDQADFGQGTALFTMGSTSGLPFYVAAVEDGAGFEWDVAAVPHTTPEPVTNIYGASVSIPRKSPEEELAAWLFVRYYTSPEVQADWARASNYFPVRESVAGELSGYFEEQPQYESGFELLEYGTFEPPVPGYDFVREEVESDMAAIVDGADVEETLAALDEEANRLLEEQLQQQPE